jgi:hypothetical protein
MRVLPPPPIYITVNKGDQHTFQILSATFDVSQFPYRTTEQLKKDRNFKKSEASLSDMTWQYFDQSVRDMTVSWPMTEGRAEQHARHTLDER